jgi:hypothetical protein
VGRNSVQTIPLLRQGGHPDFKASAQSGLFVARRKSMNHDQEQEHLTQADRHMAELKARIVRQRLILGRTLAEGRRLLVAKSTLQALEESLRIFGKHCGLILDQLKRGSSE